MRLGIHMPLLDGETGKPLNNAGLMQRARMIEASGMDGIWIGDGLAAMARPDPLMWLLVACAATERIEVGTCIYQVPLRHPAELAQRFTTLQALCEGRFVVGVGSGSGAQGLRGGGPARGLREPLQAAQSGPQEDQGALQRRDRERRQHAPLALHPRRSAHRHRRLDQRRVDQARRAGLRRLDVLRQLRPLKARGHETTFTSMRENLKRFRDYGGKRAMVSSVLVDLTEPESHLADDEPFNLFCGPQSAAERLGKLAEMGYDDVLLVKRDSTRRLSLYESDLSDEDLHNLRNLVPGKGRGCCSKLGRSDER